MWAHGGTAPAATTTRERSNGVQEMSTTLKELVEQLEARLPHLERDRFSSVFANDVFEAVDYWRNLGRYVLENNTKVNYPERAQDELELLSKFQALLQEKFPEERQKYVSLFSTSEELLQSVGMAQPREEGHRGFLKITGKHFQFLLSAYNFSVVDTQPTQLCFTSGAVYLELGFIENPSLSCVFGPATDRQQIFWIHDLLFMNGDQRYKDLPQKLSLDTEVDIEPWFGFVAGVFKQYGHPVLSNEPGILGRLSKAQAERDDEYAREMDHKFGVEKQKTARHSVRE
ncbi:MAG TPA: hypothetical protein VLA42_12200 [Verrucomicrobiae bacterium]|nr:hypothetical protein [Verrucomicrobiae bacterium]